MEIYTELIAVSISNEVSFTGIIKWEKFLTFRELTELVQFNLKI